MFFTHDDRKKLDQILQHLEALERVFNQEGRTIMSALDDLTAQVKANTDAEAAAAQLIQGLAAEIAAAAGDSAKVSALAAQLKASGDALAAAVLANTPAAPPAPAPAPDPAPAPVDPPAGG